MTHDKRPMRFFENPNNPDEYKFYPDHMSSAVYATSLWFPGHGELRVSYEQSDDRRAFGLKPAPTINVVGEHFDLGELIIKDQVGNLYELVPRRKR